MRSRKTVLNDMYTGLAGYICFKLTFDYRFDFDFSGVHSSIIVTLKYGTAKYGTLIVQ